MPPGIERDDFSNPMAPPTGGRADYVEPSDVSISALTNDDFRRLLMTPRAAPNVAPPKVAQSVEDLQSREDAAARRRKRKSHYAKLKKMEEEREAELASKYRDRAKERREREFGDEDPSDASATSGYRAVAPGAVQTMAEQRRQAMQESKFLGGDMEHTHLVKGLDYALLQKVRSDIATKDYQPTDSDKFTEHPEVDHSAVTFKTRLAKNIYRTLFQRTLPERNELFLPRRMCYAVELEEEFQDQDVPTTRIRSKADCPTFEAHTVMTTNDIVINKLTQILGYLRQGPRHDKKKLKKKDKGLGGDDKPVTKLPGANDPIFSDVGRYEPATSRHVSATKSKKPQMAKPGSYFGANQEEEPLPPEKPQGGLSREQLSAGWAAADMARFQRQTGEVGPKAEVRQPDTGRSKKQQAQGGQDSYMECYPDAMDFGAGYDSDEEADYTKMDMGNRKGPLTRWDFENEQQYNDYMDRREAMPKAAFQFGVKMSEGRKTRRFGKDKEKDEKTKLDREWQKINSMIQKRKHHGSSGEGSSSKKRAYD